jgi:hypothetical protein
MFGVEVGVGSLDTIKVKCRQLFVHGLRCGFKIIEGWHFIYEENPSDLLSKEGLPTCTEKETHAEPPTPTTTSDMFLLQNEKKISLQSLGLADYPYGVPMGGKSLFTSGPH